MAFKLTLPDGLVVEVDSAAELQEARNVLWPQQAPAHQAQQPELPVQPVDSPDSPPLDIIVFRRFLRGMPDKQRAIMDRLNAVFPESVRDEALWAVLGIHDNSKLGGTMGAIAKKAVKAGMTIDDAFTKNHWQADGVRHYSYTLTEGMRAAMPN